VETPAAEPAAPRKGEALLPLAILILRLAFATRQPFYLDWMVVLSLYWILYVFFSRRRGIEAVTVLTMLVLLTIYLSREFGQVLDTLALCR
jgi:hypothetical protein